MRITSDALFFAAFVLAAALSILKLTGHLALPWAIVLMPLWFAPALFLALALMIGAAASCWAVVAAISRFSRDPASEAQQGRRAGSEG